MTNQRFSDALQKKNDGRPPVWFMRQAGRYHPHYQALRQAHTFMDLCKKPEIAAEAAMGPIEAYDFDAAILFSDLLFPLEAMGMDLFYKPGPRFTWLCEDNASMAKLEGGAERARHMGFQAEAVTQTRKRLPDDKSLIGFVGGPATLFCYAVAGHFKEKKDASLKAMADGRYDVFVDKVSSLLVENICLQAQAGAGAMAILDTSAGLFGLDIFKEKLLPGLKQIMEMTKERLGADYPLVYYAKEVGPDYWTALADTPVDCIGVDWHHDLAEVLTNFGDRFAIQGNMDPHWLCLPREEFAPLLEGYFENILKLPAEKRRGWVSGLGHGMVPQAKPENVDLFMKRFRELF